MIQENEFITFMICLGVLIFFTVNYQKLRKISGSRMLFISFTLYTCGWFFTVIEGIIFEEIFNFIEHICYISSSGVMVVWIVILFWRKKNIESYGNS